MIRWIRHRRPAGATRCREALEQAPDWSKLRIGVPKEYFGEGACARGREIRSALRSSGSSPDGAKLVPVSLPHTQYAVAVYYVVAVSEASSNLARFDGVRFGLRPREALEAGDLASFYKKVRANFGPEVKRRIILGTFALSAGYADAYYHRACQVRRLIKQDFDRAFEQVDLIAGPVSASTAFKIGEKAIRPSADVPQRHFHHPRQSRGDSGAEPPLWRGSPRTPHWLASHGAAVRRGEASASRPCALNKRRVRMGANAEFEAVIGLEVHCQLSTESKIFCGCRARLEEGGSSGELAPNANVCPDLRGPSRRLCRSSIARWSSSRSRRGWPRNARSSARTFSRAKIIFTPICPKAIRSASTNSRSARTVHLRSRRKDGSRRKKIRIHRIHMEEDAGKNVHEAGYSLDESQSRRHAAWSKS